MCGPHITYIPDPPYHVCDEAFNGVTKLGIAPAILNIASYLEINANNINAVVATIEFADIVNIINDFIGPTVD